VPDAFDCGGRHVDGNGDATMTGTPFALNALADDRPLPGGPLAGVVFFASAPRSGAARHDGRIAAHLAARRVRDVGLRTDR